MPEQEKKVEKDVDAVVKLDTPQQDREWSAEQKMEWVKGTTRKMLSTFNGESS